MPWWGWLLLVAVVSGGIALVLAGAYIESGNRLEVLRESHTRASPTYVCMGCGSTDPNVHVTSLNYPCPGVNPLPKLHIVLSDEDLAEAGWEKVADRLWVYEDGGFSMSWQTFIYEQLTVAEAACGCSSLMAIWLAYRLSWLFLVFIPVALVAMLVV